MKKNKLAESIASVLTVTGVKAKAIPFVLAITKQNSQIGMRVSILDFNGESSKIESILTRYLSLIKNYDVSNFELFEENLDPIENLIREEAKIFLNKFGNKAIRPGLEISFENRQISMAGKYSSIPSNQNIDDPEEFVWATVNGLFIDGRTVKFKLSSNKYLVAFYLQNHYIHLHSLMNAEAPRQFLIQNKFDFNGKKDYHLIDITPDENLEIEKNKERDKFNLI